ncbi:MAG: GNAT family N-acetyltransferase [Clostridiales bacterium]|jgi:predicted acetyltransferase|nr:GNAT family N-acetyltransferase [Clostridiales bacterium]
MNELLLSSPNKSHEKQALEYMQEHFSVGERDLHGASLLEKMPVYGDWLTHLKKTNNPRTADPDWVTASTFFAVRKADKKIVGIIDIRHYLNDFLKGYGGHIGYGVRPSERRKGYATEILRLGLEYCKTINLTHIMLACYKDNAASAKTIVKNGGIFEKEFEYTDGKTIQVYWVTL